MLDKLKTLNVDRMDLDEAVALSAFAKSVSAEFTANGLSVPEYVADAAATLKNEISARQKDARTKRLKEVKLRLDGLKTTEEKRTALAAEAAELEEQLK